MEIHRTKYPYGYGHNRKTTSNWSELADDLLSTITHKLTNINDYTRFSAVCQSWHSFYVQETPSYLSRHRQVPVLIVPTNKNPYNNSLPFYSLVEDGLSETVESPLCSDFKGCFGIRSTLGWLVRASVESNVHLFNPFLLQDNEINLPQLTTDNVGNVSYLRKLTVSANPSSNSDYIIMAIYNYGHAVGFVRPGDKSWTELLKVDDMLCMDDVIYCRDRFYLVDGHGQVYLTDLSSRKVLPVGVPPESVRLNLVTDSNYLVESSGDLLLIKREREYTDIDMLCYSTTRFVVLKLDFVENEWIELENLSGDSVFIGDNSSFALSASDFPGCKPDCIYFTDDYYAGYSNIEQRGIEHDMGVFDMEMGITERGYPVDSDDAMDPPPIWLEPTLSANRKFCFHRKLELL